MHFELVSDMNGRDCCRILKSRTLCLCQKLSTDLNTWAGQIHVGFPFSLHFSVLRGLWMNKLFTVRCIQFSCNCALKWFWSAGAIQGMRPVVKGQITEKTYKENWRPLWTLWHFEQNKNTRQTDTQSQLAQTTKQLSLLGHAHTQPKTTGFVSSTQKHRYPTQPINPGLYYVNLKENTLTQTSWHGCSFSAQSEHSLWGWWQEGVP